MNATHADLVRELREARAQAWWVSLKQSAHGHGLELAFVLGICSRETNLQNITGDGGHGHGVMQVDDRWHPVVAGRSIYHASPAELIEAGCAILADYVQQVAHAHPALPPEDQLRLAADAYNEGFGGEERWHGRGDADEGTTGHDYGADVMGREKVFKTLLPPPYGTLGQ